MNITVRVDENDDGCIEGSALELALGFYKAAGSDHASIRSDSYGLSVSIDDEGAGELLRVVREEAVR